MLDMPLSSSTLSQDGFMRFPIDPQLVQPVRSRDTKAILASSLHNEQTKLPESCTSYIPFTDQWYIVELVVYYGRPVLITPYPSNACSPMRVHLPCLGPAVLHYSIGLFTIVFTLHDSTDKSHRIKIVSYLCEKSVYAKGKAEVPVSTARWFPGRSCDDAERS